MHLLLDLGQLCAGKWRGETSPAQIVTNHETRQEEARISCLAVRTERGKEVKESVLLIMEPLVLKSYIQANGPVKTGDPLHINPITIRHGIERREFGGDKAYLILTTDTLTKAPSASAAAQARAANDAGTAQENAA